MSSFDQLYVSLSLLPVTKKEKKILEDNEFFFLKELDSYGNKIYITDEGRLERSDWRLANQQGSEDSRIDLNFHGILYFYADIEQKSKKGVSMSFFAKFTDGNLVEITRSTPHFHLEQLYMNEKR